MGAPAMTLARCVRGRLVNLPGPGPMPMPEPSLSTRLLLLPALCLTLAGCLQDQPAPAGAASGGLPAPAPAAVVSLGEQLFNDATLSSTGTQACASCHAAAAGFSDPDNMLPVSEGAVAGLFGQRNTPTAAYAAFVPPLGATLEDGERLWAGGLFHDGRADTLEQQAQKPFLNAVEMNNASPADVIARLRSSPVAVAFLAVYGAEALDPGQEDLAFERVAAAIAAFERTPAFAPFNSRFDDYIAGRGTLTPQELEGMAVFARPDKGNCAACHSMARGARGEPPLFTDFTYDNLGVPRNPDATYFAADFVDEGLAATLAARGEPGSEALRGKFRVPTLRNVARTAPYMHNGVFGSLREVIEFYNTRDTAPGRWGATEVPATVNHDELGNLGLTDRDIDALVAFLNTLSDR